jgi:hypothetical protein
MKTIAILTAACLVCLFPAKVRADDAKDAVELLSYALSCPNKPGSRVANGMEYHSLWISRFTGTATQLSIETFSIVDDQNGVNGQTNSTAFSNLKSPHFSKYDDEVDLHIGCRRGTDVSGGIGMSSSSCFRTLYSVNCNPGNKSACVREDRVRYVGGIGVRLCDETAARNAKLAIDTLIKLNGGGGE